MFPDRADLRTPRAASLVVGWRGDSGGLGKRVIDYLRSKLSCREGSRIALEPFFSFEGVSVEDNVISFPDSRVYVGAGEQLLLFLSDPPHFNWYEYLNSIIDGAGAVTGVGELFTLGAMAGLISHTQPRELFMVFNSASAKKRFACAGQGKSIDYQTPPDQKPTLNSFLLWVAQQRGIPGVCLWVPIPFYLATVGDRRAEITVISHFSEWFKWRLDVSDLEREAKRQQEAIDRVREDNAEIDDYLSRVESRQDLTQEEHLKLIKAIEEGLSGAQ